MVLIIAALGFAMAVASGKIRLFSGPKALDKIVYISESGGSPDIWLMDLDGSSARQLTKNAGVRSAPAISPDGERIVYVGAFGKTDQVFWVGPNGQPPRRFTSATGPKKQPMYAPNGGKMSFISSGRVYVTDRNGEDPDPLLPTDYELRAAMTDRAGNRDIPAYFVYSWGPDSIAIAGANRNSSGDQAIMIVPRPGKTLPISASDLRGMLDGFAVQGGGTKRRITNVDRIEITGLAWAASSPTVVAGLVSRNDGFLVVFTVENDQLQLAGFTAFPKHRIGAPAISPDGGGVVVTARSVGPKPVSSLVRLDIESRAVHAVAPGEYRALSYSPEGDTVLATKHDEQKQTDDIVTIDLVTGDVTQLTHDGSSHDAIWTPKSKQ